jgi:hypothetical protein
MYRPARLVALALLLVAPGGCDAPASPPRVSPPRDAADKAALFGDPSLVPTREGERARREVALAQEIEQALTVLPSVARARVNVELPERATAEEPRVLAVVQGAPAVEESALSPRVRAIAHAVVSPAAAVEVVVEPSPVPPPPPAEPLRWPLVLAVLGLGFFGGMLVERIRRLRLAIAARPRR